MKILKYKPYEGPNPSAFQGTFTLQMKAWHGLIIEEMSYFKKGDQHWVAFPSKKYQGSDGQTKYFHYNRFEEQQTQKEFSHAVCKVLDEFILSQGPSVFKQPEQKEKPEDGLPF